MAAGNGNLDHWLTKAETAERLEMSERSLDRLIAEGKGPERRKRRRLGVRPESVYNPEDVDALAAAARTYVAPMEVARNQIVPSSGAPGAAGGMPAGLAAAVSVLEKLAEIAHRPALAAPAAAQKLFLTIEEAAGYSGLSQALLRRLARAGKLGFKDGNAWKIRRADLDNLANLATVAQLSQTPKRAEKAEREKRAKAAGGGRR